VKSSEHDLEGKQCVDVVDNDDSLPPVRSASQPNHAYKVHISPRLTVLLCYVESFMSCSVEPLTLYGRMC